MIQNTEFTLEYLLITAEKRLSEHRAERLQYWEKDLLECYWHKMTQKQIVKHLGSKKSYYKMSHLFGHKVSDFRRELSEALREPITRTSFKEPLRRQWQRDTQVNLTVIDRFINFLVYADKSINFTDLEIEVLRRIFKDQTYSQIADHIKRGCKNEECERISKCVCRYHIDYIRSDVGEESLKNISTILGNPVTKKKFKSIVEQWQKK